ASDPEITFRVQPAEIAGIDPDKVDECALVVELVEIAAEYAWTCHDHDADLVDSAVALEPAISVELDDAHAAIGQGQAGRAEANRTIRIGNGVDAGGLGHAVDLEHRQLEPVLDRRADSDGNRRSAGGRKTQARNVRVARRDAERRRQHGRHARKGFGPEALDERPK